MNKGLIFGGGFLCGAIVTILILGLIGISSTNDGDLPYLSGATYFSEPTEEFNESSFQVMQAVRDNAALVYGRSKSFRDRDVYTGTLYLLVNNSGRYYYDEEIVKVSRNQKVVHLGIYKYESKGAGQKTVPIIGIVEK